MTKSHIQFSISGIILLTSLLSGSITWTFQFIFVGIAYFFGGILITKRSHNLFKSFFILAVPFIIVYGIYPILKGFSYLYPIIVSCIVNALIGIFFGRNIIRLVSNIYKSVIILLYSLILSFVGIYLMPNWISYSVSQRIPLQNCQNMELLDLESNHKFLLSDIEGKVIVLDFFTTSCGICYKKFPEFQQLVNHYNNSKVVFYSVNIARKGDSTYRIINYFNTKKLTFRLAQIDKVYTDKLGITSVPTLVILDKRHIIVYKGNLITDKKIIINNAYRLIDNFIK